MQNFRALVLVCIWTVGSPGNTWDLGFGPWTSDCHWSTLSGKCLGDVCEEKARRSVWLWRNTSNVQGTSWRDRALGTAPLLVAMFLLGFSCDAPRKSSPGRLPLIVWASTILLNFNGLPFSSPCILQSALILYQVDGIFGNLLPFLPCSLAWFSLKPHQSVSPAKNAFFFAFLWS